MERIGMGTVIVSVGIFLLLCCCINVCLAYPNLSIDQKVQQALNSFIQGEIETCIQQLEIVIALDPHHQPAYRWLGTAYTANGNFPQGARFLQQALDMSKGQDKVAVTNFIAALQGVEELEKASGLCRLLSANRELVSAEFYVNCALVEYDYQRLDDGANYFLQALDLDINRFETWKLFIETLVSPSVHDFKLAESIARAAIDVYPNNAELLFKLGSILIEIGQYEEALDNFKLSIEIDPTNTRCMIGMASILQHLGDWGAALHWYERASPLAPNDAVTRSNLATLYSSLGRENEAIPLFLEALKINPELWLPAVNLANLYTKLDMVDEARKYLNYSIPFAEHPLKVQMKLVTLMPTVATSWEDMIRSRNLAEHSLQMMLSNWTSSIAALRKEPIDGTNDANCFYVPYHGLNDRKFLELVTAGYRLSVEGVDGPLPHVDQKFSIEAIGAKVRTGTGKVKIGFMSGFLKMFEPHGLLLDGIMKNLPRSQFVVYAIVLETNSSIPVAPSILEAIDYCMLVQRDHTKVIEVLRTIELDIIVFADTWSESVNHYLAHMRVAPIQAVFWGNPMTSASSQMDYFLSADLLEHPFRTRMPVSMEPYTEQVVLLEGQGIWYNRPESIETTLEKAGVAGRMPPPMTFSREVFGIPLKGVLYFCPQSVFKIHPLFDFILREILVRNSSNLIVVTAGRKKEWTDKYYSRLETALGGPHSELLRRFHMIPRVTSDQILGLLSIADVILHPFPFDGSRTSADALIAGAPFVTLPSEYLRGRMGVAYYKTMNLPQLVARDATEYVSIALRLGSDPEFCNEMRAAIRDRLPLIWEDMDTAYAWASFFSTAVGLSPVSWSEFIIESGRDLDAENMLRFLKHKNRAEFDRIWGHEDWLLESGIAVLEDHLDEIQKPRIFSNWNLKISDTVVHRNFAFSGDGDSLTFHQSNSLRWASLSQVSGAYERENDELASRSLLARHTDEPRNPIILLELGTLNLNRHEFSTAYYYCSLAAIQLPEYFLGHSCAASALEGQWNRSSNSLNLSKQIADEFFKAEVLHSSQNLKGGSILMDEYRGSIEHIESRYFSFINQDISMYLRVKVLHWQVNQGLVESCWEQSLNYLGLSATVNHNDLLVVLSLVNWGSLDFGHFRSLFPSQASASAAVDIIKQIQREYLPLVRPSFRCLERTLLNSIGSPNDQSFGQQRWQYLLATLMETVSRYSQQPFPHEFVAFMTDWSEEAAVYANSSNLNAQSSIPTAYKSSGIVLVTAWNENESTQRALKSNLLHPAISEIFVFCEKNDALPRLKNDWKMTSVKESAVTVNSILKWLNDEGKNFDDRLMLLALPGVSFDDSLWQLAAYWPFDFDKDDSSNVAVLQSWDRIYNGPGSAALSLDITNTKYCAWAFQFPLQKFLALNSQSHDHDRAKIWLLSQNFSEIFTALLQRTKIFNISDISLIVHAVNEGIDNLESSYVDLSFSVHI